MKEFYIVPVCETYAFAPESIIAASGSGQNMDPGDYGQNPF